MTADLDVTSTAVQGWIAIGAGVVSAISFATTAYNVYLYRKQLRFDDDYQVWLAGNMSRRTRDTLVDLATVPLKEMPYVRRAIASGPLLPRDDKMPGLVAWRGI